MYPLNEVLEISPYTSLMDFHTFGSLKRNVDRQNPRTLNKFRKKVQEEWGKLHDNLKMFSFSVWVWFLELRLAYAHEYG